MLFSPAFLRCIWPQISISESTLWEKPHPRQCPVLAGTAGPLVQAGLLSCSASLDWGRQEEIAGVGRLEICYWKRGEYLYKHVIGI